MAGQGKRESGQHVKSGQVKLTFEAYQVKTDLMPTEPGLPGIFIQVKGIVFSELIMRPFTTHCIVDDGEEKNTNCVQNNKLVCMLMQTNLQ